MLVGGPLRLLGWSYNDGTGTNDLTATGTVNAPAAGATIATLSLPNGEYTLSWTVELTGTPGAADVDNIALFLGATQVATSVNAGAVGNYAQAQISGGVTGGPLALTAKAIGNAAVGSIYRVDLTVVPLTGGAATILDGAASVLAFLDVVPGSAATESLSDGLEVQTSLSVLTTQGVISAVLYYLLESDYAPDYAHGQ